MEVEAHFWIKKACEAKVSDFDIKITVVIRHHQDILGLQITMDYLDLSAMHVVNCAKNLVNDVPSVVLMESIILLLAKTVQKFTTFAKLSSNVVILLILDQGLTVYNMRVGGLF